MLKFAGAITTTTRYSREKRRKKQQKIYRFEEQQQRKICWKCLFNNQVRREDWKKGEETRRGLCSIVGCWLYDENIKFKLRWKFVQHGKSLKFYNLYIFFLRPRGEEDKQLVMNCRCMLASW